MRWRNSDSPEEKDYYDALEGKPQARYQYYKTSASQTPGAPVAVATVPNLFRRPAKGEKERKGRLNRSPVAGPLLRELGNVTEGFDLVRVFHRSLPEEFRAKGHFNKGVYYPPSVQRQAAAVYDHFEEVDLELLVGNFLVEQASDRAYAFVGRRVGRTARKLGMLSSSGFWVGGKIDAQVSGNRRTNRDTDADRD